MKPTLIATAMLLLLILAMPPADFVSPATDALRMGDMTRPGTPEVRVNRGFVFIAETGGKIQIRKMQWVIQMVAVLVAGTIIAVALNCPKKTAVVAGTKDPGITPPIVKG